MRIQKNKKIFITFYNILPTSFLTEITQIDSSVTVRNTELYNMGRMERAQEIYVGENTASDLVILKIMLIHAECEHSRKQSLSK